MTRRSRRRGERGSAMVVVAVGAVSLIAATGLAIDGGLAAGAYRHAQNAADAGALAAVRQEFVDAVATPPVATSASSLTSVAQKEVLHNSAQLSNVSSASIGSSSGTTTLWGPSTTGGMNATGAFAELSTTVPAVPPATQAIPVDVVASRVYGWVQTAQTAPPPYAGSSASAQAELLQTNSAGQSGDVTCQMATATYTGHDNVGTQSACPAGVVPTQVSYAGSVAATPNADAQVSAGNGPSSHPDITVLNGSASITGTTVSAGASSEQTSDAVGWDPLTNAVMALSSVTATNVTASTPKASLTATTLSMSMKLSMGSADTHPKITPQCTPGTAVLTATSTHVSTTVTFASDCSTGPIPPIGDMTITGGYYSPGSDYSSACSIPKGGGWSCNVQACMLYLWDPDTSTTVCLGQAKLNFGIVPVTTEVSAFAGAVSVTASIAQPTYFMRVLGWNQTNPTATAVASVESVIDEPPSAFTASPFGMPAAAMEMDSPYIYGGLQVGHEYYLYGGNMSTYNPVIGMPSGWAGQLDSSRSGHRVGSQVVGSTAQGAPAFYPGTSYYLEPVYDPASLTILYYAEFLPVPSHPNWGLLVNSIPNTTTPANSGAITSADGAGLAWNALLPGAVTLKVVS